MGYPTPLSDKLLDIAGTGVFQIHATAYRNLRQYLGLSAPEPDPFTAIKGENSIDWLETYLRESRQWLIESQLIYMNFCERVSLDNSQR